MGYTLAEFYIFLDYLSVNTILFGNADIDLLIMSNKSRKLEDGYKLLKPQVNLKDACEAFSHTG